MHRISWVSRLYWRLNFSNLIMKYCDFEIKISTFFLEIQKSKFTFVYFMYLYVGSVVGLQANEGCLDNDRVSCRPLSSQWQVRSRSWRRETPGRDQADCPAEEEEANFVHFVREFYFVLPVCCAGRSVSIAEIVDKFRSTSIKPSHQTHEKIVNLK